MIEARLAILAEGKMDGEDALNEQAFIEECQLIIAKGAFPASSGSQAYKVGLRVHSIRKDGMVGRVEWQGAALPRQPTGSAGGVAETLNFFCTHLRTRM